MIAIKIDGDKVIYLHYRPELIDTTDMIVVDSVPDPEVRDGLILELHYNSERGFWYEYLPVPEPEPEEIPELTIDYNTEVRRLIAERYSLQDEIAIIRQRDEKPQEWQEYYDFCESCKAQARVVCRY